MPKNLIFLHLESVSQMAFWQYAAEMPTLFSLMRRSASFSRFYAASTSSVMSMSDLLHGDSSMLDHLAAFPKEKGSIAARASNLFNILRQKGYATHGVQYGSFCVGDAPNNFWGVWPESCGQFQWHSDREKMHREIRDRLEKCRAGKQSFGLYFWNMNTHIRDEDPLKNAHNLSFSERFRAGYRLLDMSVKRLLDDLTDLNLLQDTLIVAFGDHGDDLWRHGIYRGRSHIIDPYSTVCWCPLFFYNNDQDICVTPVITSMVDVKATVLSLLFPELKPEPAATPFTGVNIFGSSRRIAFSQSMFALQLERSDPIRAITKSYAVTDGSFRLMVSSPSDYDDSGGMEFYLDQWDHSNTRDLLDFCKMNPDGTIAQFYEPDAVHPHFFLTFTQKHAENMLAVFTELRGVLYAFIKEKETAAEKHFQGGATHRFPDEMFTRQRQRHS